MTHSIRINALEHIRDKAIRDIVEIERQIAEEELPRVGDTVQIVPPYEYQWWPGEAVVISIRSDRLGAWLEFKTGETAWFEYYRMKLVSRAKTPKSRRWYSTGEFFSQIPSHACFLIRWGNGEIVIAGPRVYGEDLEFLAHDGGIANKNTFKAINEAGGGKSIDGGKTWEFFGMES